MNKEGGELKTLHRSRSHSSPSVTSRFGGRCAGAKIAIGTMVDSGPLWGSRYGKKKGGLRPTLSKKKKKKEEGKG